MNSMKWLKWMSIGLLAVGCALAMSACGGGDDGKDNGGTVVVVTNVVGGTTVVVTNVVPALVAPQLVTPADGTAYSAFIIIIPGYNVAFEWTAVPGAASYVLEVDGVQTAVAGTTKTLPIPTFGNHKWRVWAKDAAGASGPASGKFSFDINIHIVMP